MNVFRTLHTGRLVLRPVAFADIADIAALKADPRVFAVMLGGVRDIVQSMEELAEDIGFWGAHGVGMWSIRAKDDERFIGITGLHLRPDGQGIGLRFALCVAAQGRGYASEAAAAALRFGHGRGGLRRIVAVARESNTGSREVLGGIGMVHCDSYSRAEEAMLIYESTAKE